MIHRGPDGTKIEMLENAGCIGHNRLSIIDLNSRAEQPMWDTSRRFCLSFNGEIYNFKSLRKTLRQQGVQFYTESDSEVLVQAWAKWEINSLPHLVGMFAFALWDNKLQQLYLVRDRMGEKPLYYAPIKNNFKNGIVFASELKGLIKYPFIEKNISMTALSHYLSFNYTRTEDAIFQNIYKLPPASILQYNLKTDELNTKEYWSLSSHFNNKMHLSFEDAKNQLMGLLSETIKEKMIADVPLGAFLSGGIDSATIVNHMARNHTRTVNTYSIGFKEKSYNELPLSQLTANYLRTNHQTRIVTPTIRDLIPQIVSSFDEPFADTSLIPTYFLCAFGRQFITVSLSGDGGDELFGGYATYQADRYHRYFRHLPLFFKNKLMRWGRRIPTSFNKVSFDYKIKQFLYGNLLDFENAHLSWREVFSEEHKKLIFRPYLHEVFNYDVRELSRRWFKDVENCHYLDQAMYVDMKTWLVDDILIKVDQTSMSHSLEVRAPFLDHRLVEFAAKLPIDYKIYRSNGKRILKESHKDQLPQFLFHKAKKGFNCPVSYWLTHELYEMAYEITTRSQMSHWFNMGEIEKLWFEHLKGVCDNGYRLFNLFCLGLWCQAYV